MVDGQLSVADFHALDLRVHSLLRDVPLHDVHTVDLPGGGRARTISDVRTLLSAKDVMKATPVVAALFGLRFFVGRVLGWDRNSDQIDPDSYLHRLDAGDRARSLLPPGTLEGHFRLLYLFPAESLSEVRNATVHAFLCAALRELNSGYRLYWAVYVKPVSWLTPAYMAMIDPFRRLIVYPSMLSRVRKAWIRQFT